MVSQRHLFFLHLFRFPYLFIIKCVGWEQARWMATRDLVDRRCVRVCVSIGNYVARQVKKDEWPNDEWCLLNAGHHNLFSQSVFFIRSLIKNKMPIMNKVNLCNYFKNFSVIMKGTFMRFVQMCKQICYCVWVNLVAAQNKWKILFYRLKNYNFRMNILLEWCSCSSRSLTNHSKTTKHYLWQVWCW